MGFKVAGSGFHTPSFIREIRHVKKSDVAWTTVKSAHGVDLEITKFKKMNAVSMNYEYFFYFKIKQSLEINIQVLIHFIHYFFKKQ